MELFDRVKAILLNPKEEWAVIGAENAPHVKVFTGYLRGFVDSHNSGLGDCIHSVGNLELLTI